MQNITQEYLKECLDYDPETGVFTWKERPLSHFKTKRDFTARNSRFTGKQAGAIHNMGYLCIRLDYKLYLCHRLAWLFVYGEWPDNQIDHIDGCRTNNKIGNLRKATNMQNCHNIKKCHISNKSTGLLGASFHKQSGKYFSRIKVNNKVIFLGCFEKAIDAHNAYIEAKRKYHPFGTI